MEQSSPLLAVLWYPYLVSGPGKVSFPALPVRLWLLLDEFVIYHVLAFGYAPLPGIPG